MLTDRHTAMSAQITDRVILECERIMSAALAIEEPEGVAIIDMTGNGKYAGLCHGSGHATAKAFCRPGIGIFLRVSEVVTEFVGRIQVHDLRLALRAGVIDLIMDLVAPIAAHEVAHAIVAPRDLDTFDADYVRSIATSYRATPNDALHHERWMTACSVIYGRCRRIAPGIPWDRALAGERRRYGLPIIDGIDPSADLRESLASRNTATTSAAA